MRLFLRKLIKFIILFLLVGVVFGYGVDFVFKRDHTDKIAWINQLENQNYDYAFLGSSRVANMTDTRILDDLTGKKGINLGVGGADLRLNYLNLEVFLSQGNGVNSIYLQVDPFAIYTNDQYNVPVYDHYFYDYQSAEPIYQALAEHRQPPLLKLNRLFPLIRYIEYNKVYKLTSLIRSLSGAEGQYSTAGFEGAGSSSLTQVQTNWEELVYREVSEQNEKYLMKIINLCQSNNIRLHLYSAPILRYEEFLSTKYPNFISLMENLAGKENLIYTNLMQQDSLNQLQLWKDMIHLNHEGVKIYSQLIATALLEHKLTASP